METRSTIWREGVEAIIAVCQIFLFSISQTYGRIILPIRYGWLGCVSSCDEALGLKVNTYLQEENPPEFSFLLSLWLAAFESVSAPSVWLPEWLMNRTLCQPTVTVWARKKLCYRKSLRCGIGWLLQHTPAHPDWYGGDINIGMPDIFNLWY